MTTDWTMRRTMWGYTLYWRGEVVCSADSPMELVRHVAEWSQG